MQEFLDTEEVGSSSLLEPTISNKTKELADSESSQEVSIDLFLSEKRYLENVSERTLELYQYSFKAFTGSMERLDDIKARIVTLRKAGLSACSVNTYLRHLKCFYLWQGKAWKLPWLKEEQKILNTFTQQQISTIVRWKPLKTAEVRLKILTLTAVDTGLRIDELLTLTRGSVSLENLMIKVKGKGNKERLVPMSIELRKHLYRHLTTHSHQLVFCSKNGGKLSQRNVLRDFKIVCKKLRISNVRASFHTLRHSMAVSYLRSGGNIYFLSRILGHTTVKTTERYLKSLGIEDLNAVHSSLSLLSK